MCYLLYVVKGKTKKLLKAELHSTVELLFASMYVNVSYADCCFMCCCSSLECGSSASDSSIAVTSL